MDYLNYFREFEIKKERNLGISTEKWIGFRYIIWNNDMEKEING